MARKVYALVIENGDNGMPSGVDVLGVSSDTNLIRRMMKESFNNSLDVLENSEEFTVDEKFYSADVAELNWHSDYFTFSSTWFICETKLYEVEGD